MPTQLELAGGEVVQVPIEERMEQAFLDYAMSVIVGRALPSVYDGLKPVQRRILYSMYESGLRPDRPHRKCASTVGEVMKKYHPHSDTAIYDALVRMAQDFSSREPLVDGHGNFGSIDGDPPAAMRYTEARLSPVAMAMLDGIDEETVEFVENYDGYEREPVVLPARIPNLLVNGASGIAVGMATNIPPHNLGEVIDAVLHLVEHPDAGLDDLIRIVPGPDLPTGARIIRTEGIREAYASGKGAIRVEAVATTEMRSGNLPRIIVTEIPFQVNKAALLERIAALVHARKLDAIRDLRDESSRDGMRIVIELKRGEDPARVLERLYQLTDLRTNFNVNTVALVEGAPRTLGLRDCLVAYVGHQRSVLTRRTAHRRARAAARAHLLEGLLLALDHLDEVIALIRAAKSADAAKGQLIRRFGLSELQAQAVLDMQLRRLARLERGRLVEEHRELQRIIEELERILADPGELDRVLVAELSDLKRVHATPRRSRIVSADTTADDVLAGAPEAGFDAQPVTAYVTAGGYLKPIPERRTSPPHSHPHDPLAAVLRCTTTGVLLLVDERGTGYRVDLADLPVVGARHRGTHLAQVVGAAPEARIAGAVVLGSGQTIVTLSAMGQVKRTSEQDALGRNRTFPFVRVRDGDRIAAVVSCSDGDHLTVAHSGGQLVRFPATDVRVTGRGASGVIAMVVPEGEQVVAASVLEGGSNTGTFVTLGADGTGKRSPASDYPVQARGGKGVQTGGPSLLWCGAATDLHVAGETPGIVRPVDLPETGRTARGRPLATRIGPPVVPERLAG